MLTCSKREGATHPWCGGLQRRRRMGAVMLTLEDCLALSGLDEAEIDAIAEHEHLPLIIAAELGNYLSHSKRGGARIKQMILDDIADAMVHGDRLRALKLRLVLRHFCETHTV